MTLAEIASGNGVQLRIYNFEVTPLLDTGSDVSPIREDIFL